MVPLCKILLLLSCIRLFLKIATLLEFLSAVTRKPELTILIYSVGGSQFFAIHDVLLAACAFRCWRSARSASSFGRCTDFPSLSQFSRHGYFTEASSMCLLLAFRRWTMRGKSWGRAASNCSLFPGEGLGMLFSSSFLEDFWCFDDIRS